MGWGGAVGYDGIAVLGADFYAKGTFAELWLTASVQKATD